LDIDHAWYLGLAVIMLFRPTNICFYNLARDHMKMKVLTKIMFVIQYYS